MEFKITFETYTAQVEKGIQHHLPPPDTRPTRIHQAMRYSMQAGGKRLRPVLCLATADILGSRLDPLPAAVALECIHTYSLIHDDLPCMDDGQLRRGQPTCHRQFDEWTAVLAGDALPTYAFELIARSYQSDPALGLRLTQELAETAGSRRLIGGQVEDILGEKSDYTAEQLNFIHLNKTAALLASSLVMGGLVAEADEQTLGLLRDIGRQTGVAFQIIDDILDATSDSSSLGKTAGGDAKTEKTTYIKVHGLDESRRLARSYTQQAAALTHQLPGDAHFLTTLIERLEHRLS
jgi:geranylgeranyl diphosphate synthase, type II